MKFQWLCRRRPRLEHTWFYHKSSYCCRQNWSGNWGYSRTWWTYWLYPLGTWIGTQIHLNLQIWKTNCLLKKKKEKKMILKIVWFMETWSNVVISRELTVIFKTFVVAYYFVLVPLVVLFVVFYHYIVFQVQFEVVYYIVWAVAIRCCEVYRKSGKFKGFISKCFKRRH